MLELVGTEQMVSEPVAEIHGYISEGAFPTCEDLEMLITNAPFGVGFLLGYLLIVRKEILFLLAMIDETELAVSLPVPECGSAEARLSQASSG